MHLLYLIQGIKTATYDDPNDRTSATWTCFAKTNQFINIIQMMHGSECDIQILRTGGRKCLVKLPPECDIFNQESSYLNVARMTVLHVFCRKNNHRLKYDFSLHFNFYQQLGEHRSTQFARWRCNIQHLHLNKLKCKFLL